MGKKPRLGEDPLSWIKDTTTPKAELKEPGVQGAASAAGISGRTIMTDNPLTKNLEGILTRMETGWQELTEALRSRSRAQGRVIEAERFVLVDAAGQPRGQLAVKEDGSAGLSLIDKDERYRAWLGVEEDGSAFLSLRGQNGQIFFEVRDNSGNSPLTVSLEEPITSRHIISPATRQTEQAPVSPEVREAQQMGGPEPAVSREFLDKEEKAKFEAAAYLEVADRELKELRERLSRVEAAIRLLKYGG
jgi:hypothetical protein